MNRRTVFSVMLAVVVAAASASAAVIFDPNTGNGWVGKGDVQTAFGWNNHTMQANHTSVTFEYEATAAYNVVCEWFTGGQGNSEVTRHETTTRRNVNSGLALGDSDRKTGQWTGWNLTGLGSEGSGAEVPVVGGPCPGNQGNDKWIIAVELVEGSGSVGTLYAVHNGTSRAIWYQQ